MPLAEWFTEQRKSSGLSLRQFADQVGVDHNLISKIERGEIETTLTTVVRLCEGLSISAQRLIEDVYGETPTAILSNPVALDEHRVLRQSDVRAFQAWFYLNPSDALAYIARQMSFVGYQSAILLHKPASPSTLAPQEIAAFFLDNPAMRRAELYHPGELFTASQVIATYKKNGALLFVDVGTVIKEERLKYKETIADFGKRVSLSSATISRLENGSIERLLVDDLFHLDQALNMGGLLLAMFWVSARFTDFAGAFRDIRRQEGISGYADIDEFELAQLFVTLARWLEVIDSSFGWLEELRVTLNAALNNYPNLRAE